MDGEYWVWLMGDHDYLVSANCPRTLARIVNDSADDSVDLIHLTQATQVRQFEGQVIDLYGVR